MSSFFYDVSVLGWFESKNVIRAMALVYRASLGRFLNSGIIYSHFVRFLKFSITQNLLGAAITNKIQNYNFIKIVFNSFDH